MLRQVLNIAANCEHYGNRKMRQENVKIIDTVTHCEYRGKLQTLKQF